VRIPEALGGDSVLGPLALLPVGLENGGETVLTTTDWKTEFASFLRAMEANPEDMTVRLVAADWLDERGQWFYAEALRWSCRLWSHGDGWGKNDRDRSLIPYGSDRYWWFVCDADRSYRPQNGLPPEFAGEDEPLVGETVNFNGENAYAECWWWFLDRFAERRSKGLI